MPKTLLVRADASARIGTGHVMRCLALAQAWQDRGGQAIYATANQGSGLESRLTAENVPSLAISAEPGSDADAGQTVAFARQVKADWIVVDGYHFSGRYQRLLKVSGVPLLAIDDHGHAGQYCADLVVNQNLHARESFYLKRAPGTRLLLGTRYVLLRREFRRCPRWKRPISDVACKVLVTLGGADPDNLTVSVVEGLRQLQMKPLQAIVVAGASNPHYEALERATRRCRGSVRLQANVTDMPKLMAWADVAIAAGGTTLWELAFFGLPSIVLILAENQVASARLLAHRGICLSLGEAKTVKPSEIAQCLRRLLADPGERARLAARAAGLVDGHGVHRVRQRLDAAA